MAGLTKVRLRGFWLQVHKWTGLALGILIIAISLSGAALVWDEWLDRTINPHRYAVAAADSALPASRYAAIARNAAGPGHRIVSLRFPDGEGPVVATAAPERQASGGRPVRTSVWIDPGSGRVLDSARSDSGALRILHNLHGSLMVPGLGRSVVGWVGIAMFLSCLTGLWLWWPIAGGFRRGFRWRRQSATSANLHHQMGIWILLPLAMLSFTGAWISFPAWFGRFDPPQPDRSQALRALPLARTALTPEAAIDLAKLGRPGQPTVIAWPTDRSPDWKVTFKGASEIAVGDVTGRVKPPAAPKPETKARLMRRLHDGTGMGALWQAIIFLGGLLPAALAVTGFIMWLRSRGWRARARRKDPAIAQPAPAE